MMKTPRATTLTGMIVCAALSRLLPHPWNFSPITAMALFSGAHFSKKKVAFLTPLAALFLSDIVIGFYKEMWAVYGSFALIVFVGLKLRDRRRLLPVTAATAGSSLFFFIFTNLVMWFFHYPHSLAGLAACYTAAIPFFQNAIIGDLFYTGVLFGLMAAAEKRFPVLSEQPTAV